MCQTLALFNMLSAYGEDISQKVTVLFQFVTYSSSRSVSCPVLQFLKELLGLTLGKSNSLIASSGTKEKIHSHAAKRVLSGCPAHTCKEQVSVAISLPNRSDTHISSAHQIFSWPQTQTLWWFVESI